MTGRPLLQLRDVPRDLARVLPETGTVGPRRTSTAGRHGRRSGSGPARQGEAAMNFEPTVPSPHSEDAATAWMAAGNCRLYPPATFFPSDGVGVEKARKICNGCPVASPCLE